MRVKEWFCKTLDSYRGSDNRTMYVGITGVNIYSGNSNYLFSLNMRRGSSQASIMSYSVMLAKAQDKHPSRSRLIQRIAKELVPASLKSLNIPRSTDPSCPYSYSDGVQRLDEKTLQLSEPVSAALNELRKQNGEPATAPAAQRH